MVLNINFSPDGKFIAVVGTDFMLKVWGINGWLYQSIYEDVGKVCQALYSPDGKYLAVESSYAIKIYSLPNHNLIDSLKIEAPNIMNWEFSETSESLYFIKKNGNFEVWTFGHLQTLKVFPIGIDEGYNVSFSGNKAYLTIISNIKRDFAIWNVSSSGIKKNVRLPSLKLLKKRLLEYEKPPVISSDGKRLYCILFDSSETNCYNLETGREIWAKKRLIIEAKNAVFSCDVSSKIILSQRVYSNSSDDIISISVLDFNTNVLKSITELKASADHIRTNEGYVYYYTQTQNQIKIYHIASQKFINYPNITKIGSDFSEFHITANYLLFVNDSRDRVYSIDLASGKQIDLSPVIQNYNYYKCISISNNNEDFFLVCRNRDDQNAMSDLIKINIKTGKITKVRSAQSFLLYTVLNDKMFALLEIDSNNYKLLHNFYGKDTIFVLNNHKDAITIINDHELITPSSCFSIIEYQEVFNMSFLEGAYLIDNIPNQGVFFSSELGIIELDENVLMRKWRQKNQAPVSAYLLQKAKLDLPIEQKLIEIDQIVKLEDSKQIAEFAKLFVTKALGSKDASEAKNSLNIAEELLTSLTKTKDVRFASELSFYLYNRIANYYAQNNEIEKATGYKKKAIQVVKDF